MEEDSEGVVEQKCVVPQTTLALESSKNRLRAIGVLTKARLDHSTTARSIKTSAHSVAVSADGSIFLALGAVNGTFDVWAVVRDSETPPEQGCMTSNLQLR